jgi:hypothetical protein
VDGEQRPCLGRFKQHSCEAWHWNAGRYYRECSLMGCAFSETAGALVPTGRTETTGARSDHSHDWNPWRSTADQFGLYTPPWSYRRTCSGCNVVQIAESLDAATEQ